MGTSDLAGPAYSYLRFSSKPQEGGDSIRRQTDLRDRWLARNPGVRLVPDGEYSALGVSAFRGKHRTDDRAALKLLLSNVESGKIRRGSFLIVESLDRLTREELGDAFELVLGLVNRGIRIVQLSPVESILQKPVNMTALMLAVVELSRANSESQVKSDRIGAAWSRKRTACRDSGEVLTRRAKVWLDIRGGKFVFKDGARALIRRMFKMATAGHGCRTIARTLNEECGPNWAGRPWISMYVRSILRGREVRGELHTRLRRQPRESEVIVGYYPVAVTEAEWLAAQNALKARTRRGGRPPKMGEHVNIFSGLLYEAKSGDRLHIFSNRGMKILKRAGWHQRGERGHAFPLVPFERAILSRLAEIDPAEILDRPDGPDEVAEVSAQLVRLDAQIKALTDATDDTGEAVGDEYGEPESIPELVAKIKARHADRKKLADRLESLKLAAASPLSGAWGECKGLIDALDRAKDVREMRTRLRQAIARTVESVHCLFVPVGKSMTMAAAARVQFAGGGKHRDYLLLYKPRHVNQWRIERPADCKIRSLDLPDLPGEFDLRNLKHAAELEKLLAAVRPPAG